MSGISFAQVRREKGPRNSHGKFLMRFSGPATPAATATTWSATESLREAFRNWPTKFLASRADTLHAHGKQLGNLERWAALKRQPEPRGIVWSVIKKHVTGQGSASRQTMLATVAKAMPEVTDHNQASAVAVMLTATNQKLPTTEASPRAAQPARSAGP